MTAEAAGGRILRSRIGGALGGYASRWSLLSLATLLYWLATQSLRPYVSLHLTDLGASEPIVGLALAAHPFLSMLLAIPAGRFMDVHGIRKMMVLSSAGMAGIGAAYAVVEGVPQFIAVQAAAGLCELGAWVGIQALITRIEDPGMRKRHLGLFSVTWALGVAAGPTLGAFAFEANGFGAIGALYALCAASAVLCVLGVPHRDAKAPREQVARRDASGGKRTLHRMAEVLSAPGVGPTLAASFVMLWANNLRVSFYPLLLERAGVPVTTIGYLISLAGITLLLSRLPLPLVLHRIRSLTVLMAGTATAAVAVAATPLLVASPAALWLAAALFGVGFGLNSPVTIDLIADGTDPRDRGMAMGMRVASNRLAQVGQPLLFGAVAGPFGMTAGFAAASTVMGGVLGWAAQRSRRAASVRRGDATRG